MADRMLINLSPCFFHSFKGNFINHILTSCPCLSHWLKGRNFIKEYPCFSIKFVSGYLKGFIVKRQTIILTNKKLNCPKLYFLVHGFQINTFGEDLKIFFLKTFLFFYPVLASCNCILELNHLTCDNFILLELVFFRVKDFDCLFISLDKFFNLFSCFDGFVYLLFDIFRNLVFMLFPHFD